MATAKCFIIIYKKIFALCLRSSFFLLPFSLTSNRLSFRGEKSELLSVCSFGTITERDIHTPGFFCFALMEKYPLVFSLPSGHAS
jgi:hypothetical protein